MNIIIPDDIQRGTFSMPKDKNQIYKKAKLQRLIIKNEELIQLSLFSDKQVFHRNILIADIAAVIEELLNSTFNSLELETNEYIYGYKISSKGKLLTNKRLNKKEFVVLEHNKKKNYLLPEGEVIQPLIDLGVMTADGKVIKARNDKYKQINRFLEIIEDSIYAEKKLKIIDFGCGKSYLTFILYYYLVFIKKIECEIIGLDLKEDVVDNCNKIAEKYNYKNLKFYKGDISKFSESDSVDMIVTLHACDTATDYALYHAINMKCKYIFSVPCCQHEINGQLKNDKVNLVTKYGILKERLSAIYTDAIRANILQYYGYKTQVLEFIDFDASPKNLLIRAKYQNLKKDESIKEELDSLISNLNVNQTLYNLLMNKR